MRAVLLLYCPDRKGMVAAMADFLYRHGGNIVHADQHHDAEAGMFFQRVEWDLAGFAFDRARSPRPSPLAERFAMAGSSASPTSARACAVRLAARPLPRRPALAPAHAASSPRTSRWSSATTPTCAAVADCFGVPFHVLPLDARDQAEEEAAIAELCRRHASTWWCWPATCRCCRRLRGPATAARIINIHHSFLPAFVGARPYHQAHERGVKLIGATAHYATEELDEGPIIEQDVVRVSHRDAVDDLVRKGRDLEKVVLARAVGLHLAIASWSTATRPSSSTEASRRQSARNVRVKPLTRRVYSPGGKVPGSAIVWSNSLWIAAQTSPSLAPLRRIPRVTIGP